MIQIGAACVLTTMNSALPSLAAPARADNGPAQARAPAGCVCLVAVERGGNMSSPQSWDRLIVSLATDRDREAFASLFAHFAPRLKTFMLRQGMDKAGAEEPRALARLRLAGVLLDQQRYDDGLKALDGAGVPPAFEALFADRRGDLYVAMKKPDDARKAYQTAIEKLSPQSGSLRSVVQLKLDALGEG